MTLCSSLLSINTFLSEVSSLVSYVILVTDGDAFHGESWTVQCEIIQQHMLRTLPQDEDHGGEQ
jgi:hypothetical protein